MSNDSVYSLYFPKSSSVKFGNDGVEEKVANRYLKSHRDPVIGTQTKRVTFSETSNGWEMSSSLPIKIDFPKGSDRPLIDWSELSESEPQGNALWKYSVGYLPTLVEATGDFGQVQHVIDELWEFTNSSDWPLVSAWMTSLDHCLATRIRALCTLHVLWQNEGLETPASLRLILINDVANLVSNGESYFPINNHGAMAAISLLHSAALFPWLDQNLQEAGLPSAKITGWNNLSNVIDKMFDEHGIASENSPEYQRFWISLLEPVAEFVTLFPSAFESNSEDSIDVSEMQSAVSKAREALTYFVDGEGRMLAIGDSHPRRLSNVTPSVVSQVFEASGFTVFKDKGTTFTMNCGSTNYAHKHCDDTSITLDRDGTNLILDAGYFSHDWNDEKAIYTKSQSAHSGFFMTGLDDLHPGKVHFPGRERVRSSTSHIPAPSLGAEGTSTIDEKVTLSRKALIHSDRSIDIVDFATGDFTDLGYPVSRFIFPAQSEIDIDGTTLRVKVDQQILEITAQDLQPGEFFKIYNGQSVPVLRGWISPELNTLVPAYCVDLNYARQTPRRLQIRIV